MLELDLDPARKVLFVEGERDLAFWREVVPTLDRKDAVVYAISSIEMANCQGGERGRALACAAKIGAVNRVHFFVDADYDRVLGIHHTPNVTLTDGRDLETYALTKDTLGKMCSRWFAQENDGSEILLCLVRFGRPLGTIRILSARQALNMPFKKTFEGKRLDRYLGELDGNRILNIERILSTLLQNSLGLTFLDEVRVSYDNELLTLAAVADAEIIHGKDAIWILSWHLDVTRDDMERILYCCLDYDVIRKSPNIRKTVDWLTGQ